MEKLLCAVAASRCNYQSSLICLDKYLKVAFKIKLQDATQGRMKLICPQSFIEGNFLLTLLVSLGIVDLAVIFFVDCRSERVKTCR